jgi:PAS domain S-box-containing protein
MKDENKTKKQILAELMELRVRVGELERIRIQQENALNILKNKTVTYQLRPSLSTDAIYVIFDRKFEYVNQVFEGLFGYTADEIYRPEFEFMNLFAPESRKSVQKIFDEGVKGCRGFHQFEFIGQRKDGGTFACETSAIFIPYKWGVAVNGTMWYASHTENHQQIIVKKDGIERAVGF